MRHDPFYMRVTVETVDQDDDEAVCEASTSTRATCGLIADYVVGDGDETWTCCRDHVYALATSRFVVNLGACLGL
ncbi:hypothetical protein [Humibacter sp.]|uniref:hypothetical protein n=1 Tax=Humibacter sp. TaxID=1940291 RepID=UPI002C96F9DC|nr:hypothetical protein [Humibacter sp.]HVX09212.1 hypothetical protein [Humibacter sp.]